MLVKVMEVHNIGDHPFSTGILGHGGSAGGLVAAGDTAAGCGNTTVRVTEDERRKERICGV